MKCISSDDKFHFMIVFLLANNKKKVNLTEWINLENTSLI